MAKVIRSADIAQQIIDAESVVPTNAVEEQALEDLRELLIRAARLGKISGLRRARKNARLGLGVEGSIKNTYIALGADTDAYEQEQADKRQARLDAALGTFAYEAGVQALNDEADAARYAAQTERVYLTEEARDAAQEPQHEAFSNNVIAGFAGMADLTVPSVIHTTTD